MAVTETPWVVIEATLDGIPAVLFDLESLTQRSSAPESRRRAGQRAPSIMIGERASDLLLR